MGMWNWLYRLFSGETAHPQQTAAGPLPRPAAAGLAGVPAPAARRRNSPIPAISQSDLEHAHITVTSNNAGPSSATFIRLEGILNSVTADELEDKLQTFIEGGEVNLVVDFSGVPYVSSRGWGILISVVQAIRKSGGDIKIAGMCPNVLKLFIQTGLSSIFEMYEGPPKQRMLEEEP